MPELPDIEVFSRNLEKLCAGKRVSKVKVVNGKKLKDTPKKLSTALTGKKLLNVYRYGKELRFVFTGNLVMGMHLMLTGDLYLLEGGNKYTSTIVEIHFNDGSYLALTDRMKNAHVTLNPEGKDGIDALDPGLNFKKLKEILQRKTNIKNVLLDQNSILGIGNGYSDEILWKTRISPFSRADAIPEEKIRELAKNIKQVLKSATNKIAKNHPDLIHGEVRDYMQIHTKHKKESPTGAPIRIAERGMLKTYYTEEQVEYK